MIDKAKRQTLKRMSAASAATAASLSGVALAGNSVIDASVGNAESTVAHSRQLEDEGQLGSFQVHTRVSTATNDIEIVLTNTGSRRATITQMTPYETVTQRGRFVFGDLLDAKGKLSLDAGQSVSVPLQRHSFAASHADVRRGANSLADTLRRGVSIVVDGKSFAPVTVVGLSPLV